MSEWRLSPKLKENVFRKKFNISFSLQTQPARRWGGSDWLFSLPLRHSLCSILRTVEVSGICNSVTSLGRTAKEFEDASEIEKNIFMDISRRRVDGLIKSMTRACSTHGGRDNRHFTWRRTSVCAQISRVSRHKICGNICPFQKHARKMWKHVLCPVQFFFTSVLLFSG